MRSLALWFFALCGLLLLLTVSGAFFIVPETEQVVLTQFGRPVGSPITEAGIHFKMPFVQEVNRLEKRVLQWDGPSTEMPTKDKLYIIVDCYARWRITDPLRFFLRLRDERSGLSRLDDIIGSEARNTVARHELVELVRTTKGRQPQQDDVVANTPGLGTATLPPIQYGRLLLEKEVTQQSREKLEEFGIELLDMRFMRINYNPAVASKIYDRMMSERRQIAERFRSEGAGEAAKIMGTRERDIKKIASEAYRQSQTLQGKADAEATAIYAEAYNQNPQAREYYEFQRALDTYKTAFGQETTLILTTENGFLRHLQGEPRASAASTPGPSAAHPVRASGPCARSLASPGSPFR